MAPHPARKERYHGYEPDSRCPPCPHYEESVPAFKPSARRERPPKCVTTEVCCGPKGPTLSYVDAAGRMVKVPISGGGGDMELLSHMQSRGKKRAGEYSLTHYGRRSRSKRYSKQHSKQQEKHRRRQTHGY